MSTIIKTDKAPLPIGPYSQAILRNGTLYASGQIALDPVSGNMIQHDIQSETKQVLENVKAILKEAGMSFNDVVKCSIFITDMQQFAEINEIYGTYFKDFLPARETVQVSALPKGASIEISITAIKS